VTNLFVDWKVNAGDRRIQISLFLFRLAARARRPGSKWPKLAARAVSAFYTFLVEWTWGIELPWATRVGPRLRIFHGTGLVVNAEAQLGADVVLRQGVCIGSKRAGGASPVVGDTVEFGAAAIVLGAVHVGNGSSVGAGAVVLQDVPAGGRMVGNPGRLL
jgi:putative colanic acid biosynthesis acetyltransferase WcaB